ncbi:putative pectinesterase [Medicago truncatula]|uniref:pectinesterase n=1 Tax=Medicago truncatula TaxID=3880 RepID=G7K7Q1_MEDTR|nr:pectinesterase [Medicago truncatula]RHN57484.1 putative pectinesterase [Medicago truncatula]
MVNYISSRPMIFQLIIFISCCFCLGIAIDCGGNHVRNAIIVDQQGKGEFKKIQPAIDSIKNKNDHWVKIHINPGKYVENVNIPYDKPCIILEGSDRKTTKITYGDGKATTTFFSFPPNVILSGITFENTFGNEGPAIAAIINGDKSAVFDCGFLGYQDTLFDATGRHYFKNCYIQGEVDFIFGEAQSYFEECVINATQDSSKPPGFITAQRRNSSTEPSGFVFRGGEVTGIGKVNLGRAYGPYSRVIFWETYLSSVVLSGGWDPWKYGGHEKNFIYAEVDCTGPGSNTQGRVPWEKKPNEININDYSLSSFINEDRWLSNIPPIHKNHV